MNIRHLSVFHAVARSGSVSGGAAALHVSQPAVSKQLHELEARQGVRLFDRLPRGIRLTEAGRVLTAYADQIFALESEAERALEDLRGLQAGSLAIGASTTIGSYLLPDLLVAFGTRYPKIKLSLEVANTEVIQTRLLAGELDLGFTEGFVAAEGLEAEVFLMDELLPVAAPGHPLLAADEVSVERLCREPMIVREAGSGTLAVMEAALARRGVKPRPVISLGASEAIKRAVRAGAGVAFISGLAVRSELDGGTLGVIPVRDLRIERPLHRVRLRYRHQSATETAFLALLAEHAPKATSTYTGRRSRPF